MVACLMLSDGGENWTSSSWNFGGAKAVKLDRPVDRARNTSKRPLVLLVSKWRQLQSTSNLLAMDVCEMAGQNNASGAPQIITPGMCQGSSLEGVVGIHYHWKGRRPLRG